MRISVIIDNTCIDGELYDNECGRAFAAILPLTITLTDYDDTEKCGELPDILPSPESPTGHDPHIGDIVYYPPCGCLSIYYRDNGYCAEQASIGRITGDMAKLHAKKTVTATFTFNCQGKENS